jgi:sugar phosphate permease
VLTGTVDSFGVLSAMRVAHGALASMVDPLFFAMMAMYFPRSQRGTANSLLQTANYAGISLSSLSIILINSVGWRQSYNLMGFFAIGAAALAALIVRDP